MGDTTQLSNSAICDTALKVVESAVQSYDEKYKQWRKDVSRLTKERDEAKDAYLLADITLANTEPNARLYNRSNMVYDFGGECSWWDSKRCNNTCSDRVLTTPGGRKSKWNAYMQQSDCKYGKTYCICEYVSSWDTSDLTNKKILYEKKETELKNRLSQEPKYKDEDAPEVRCCVNQINCDKGRCSGNIQECKTHITKLGKKENENIVIKSIKDLETIFNGLYTNYNQNKIIFKNYYNTFNNINFENTNINIIYNQIKILYDNLTAIFNEIIKNVEHIIIYNDSFTINNGRIGDDSNFKSDSKNIMTTADRKTQNIIYEYQNEIVEQYILIKDIFDNIERDNENYDFIISKKKLMDNNIKNFNIDIENINNTYTKINSLNIINDTDVETLFKSIDDINNLFNNKIRNNKQSINDLFNEIKILYNTIAPTSFYFNIAKDIYIACDNTNILLNNKFDNIENLLTKINNIGISKKTNYEKEKKIKEDNMILLTLEGNEEKIKSDILLLKLLENNNISIPTTTPIITTPETVKIDYTMYIIVGAVVIIIFIFFFKNNYL